MVDDYGNDFAWPGPGRDTISTGRDADNLRVSNDGVPDTIDCGRGKDSVYLPNGKDDTDTYISCETFTTT